MFPVFIILNCDWRVERGESGTAKAVCEALLERLPCSAGEAQCKYANVRAVFLGVSMIRLRSQGLLDDRNSQLFAPIGGF